MSHMDTYAYIVYYVHMQPLQIKRMEEECVFTIKQFKEKNGYWPRTHEISTLARRIQRYLGGMVAFRKKYNLGCEDYTKGDYRSSVARASNFKATVDEQEIGDFLIEKYGKVNVHREYLIYSNTKNRADFCIFKNGKESFIIDVFYPKDLYSFKGCLNLKMKKYKSCEWCPIIFVQLNDLIKEEDMDYVFKNKKSHLSKNITVMSLNQFKDYINKHTQQSVV